MGLRFHKVFSILPGVRVNLSKSGLSTSLGPRGADVNIGRHGVTTNAGIPGTGLSYRSKMGSKSSKVGVMALICGLAFAAYKSADKIGNFFHPKSTSHVAATSRPSATAVAAQNIMDTAKPATGVRYIRRGGSDIREQPKTSVKVLKKEPRGQRVMLLATSDLWAKVRDGDVTGWMRASVLGTEAPQ